SARPRAPSAQHGPSQGQNRLCEGQTPPEHRHHRPRGPRENHPDGCDHQSVIGRGRGPVPALRGDRQRPRGEGARHHHQRGARGVQHPQPALRPHRLPG
ncbi:hypothetical protein HGM15179_021550, partial [Zosterops borbonicus]